MINDAVKRADYAIDLCQNGELDINVRIFPYTNECFYQLFSHTNFKNKDVFSVMASGDQPIYAHMQGAKSVETFDRNYNSLYHFYLRKWIIKWSDNEIGLSDSFFKSKDESLKEIIDSVTPNNQDEQSSLIFWKRYFDKMNYKGSSFLFDKDYNTSMRNLSFSNEELKPEIDRMNFKFYNIDICNKVTLSKTYDIVILSNILEYNSNLSVQKQVKMNLEKLLNPGGIAICSYKLTSPNSESHRRQVDIITSNDTFEIEEYGHTLWSRNEFVGYQYKKIK